MVYAARKKKGLPFLPTLVQTLPIVVYVVFGYLWLAAPSSVILQRHVPLFVLTLGIVFGRIAVSGWSGGQLVRCC